MKSPVHGPFTIQNEFISRNLKFSRVNLFTKIANDLANMAPCGMSQYVVDNII